MKNDSSYETMSIHDIREILHRRGIDTSHCVEKSDLITLIQKSNETDYDEEGRKLFAELNLQPTLRDKYSNLDAIWRHRHNSISREEEKDVKRDDAMMITDGRQEEDSTNNDNNNRRYNTDSNGSSVGGTVYVGNYQAACKRRILDDHKITVIINCQDEGSKNFFERDSKMNYYRFTVSYWFRNQRNIARNIGEAYNYFYPLFCYIDDAICKGQNVLIHCLAGAHRAGTVGVAYLMYKRNLSLNDALETAKKLRRIINPFGTLLELLKYLERDINFKQEKGKEKDLVADKTTL